MIDLAATDKILENGTSNTSIAYVAALLICKDNVKKKKYRYTATATYCCFCLAFDGFYRRSWVGGWSLKKLEEGNGFEMLKLDVATVNEVE